MINEKKYSFEDIINIIFKKKEEYHKISDIDKENSFFKINRKFSRLYPTVANIFNKKYIDKASVIDKWFLYFKNNNNIPTWYWENKKSNKNITIKNNLSNDDILLLKKIYHLKDNDILYLYKNYNKVLLDTLKKHKK